MLLRRGVKLVVGPIFAAYSLSNTVWNSDEHHSGGKLDTLSDLIGPGIESQTCLTETMSVPRPQPCSYSRINTAKSFPILRYFSQNLHCQRHDPVPRGIRCGLLILVERFDALLEPITFDTV